MEGESFQDNDMTQLNKRDPDPSEKGVDVDANRQSNPKKLKKGPFMRQLPSDTSKSKSE